MHLEFDDGSPKDPEKNAPTPELRGKSRERKSLYVAIALSIAVHLVVVFIAPFLFRTVTPHDKEAGLRVWLTPRKEAPLKQEQKKIVVSLEQKSETRPEKATYLAEHNRVVKKEQRARVAEAAQAPAQDHAQKQSQGSDDGHVKSRQPKKRAAHLENKDAPGLREKHADEDEQQPNEKSDPLGIRPHSFGYKAQNATANNDHLPNLAEGDSTDLNAWQWRHAPFFNRIKSRIGHVWSPHEQITRYDPQGSMLGHKDRVTVMSVTINREGQLIDLAVTNPSGVAYLDDEAIRAFRVAAPFLYPPKELFNDQNEFSFSFAFHLQINRGISFDFDWKND